MPGNSLPFRFPLTRDLILSKRARILAALLGPDPGFCSIPVSSLKQNTLLNMLRLYDEAFFDGYLGRKLPALTVTVSSRLTSSAGKFICTKGPFGRIRSTEIRMSGDFLSRLTDGPFQLNGLSVATPQEAFLVVFEHELCHAAETLLFGSTGHSDRFLSLANGLFGHTETRHSLPTRRQEAAQDGLTIGKRVQFTFQGTVMTGFISYIGKQVTVMVPDPKGDYRDRSGKRYCKYRVPIDRIRLFP